MPAEIEAGSDTSTLPLSDRPGALKAPTGTHRQMRPATGAAEIDARLAEPHAPRNCRGRSGGGISGTCNAGKAPRRAAAQHHGLRRGRRKPRDTAPQGMILPGGGTPEAVSSLPGQQEECLPKGSARTVGPQARLRRDGAGADRPAGGPTPCGQRAPCTGAGPAQPSSSPATHCGTTRVAGPCRCRSKAAAVSEGSRLISSVAAPWAAASATKPAAG